MHWKTLSSRYLFKDRWLTMRADVYERPDGKIVDPYYVYEFPDWVVAVPITKDGKIVMVKQYRHALGEVCIELPGGCVDASDQNFSDAVARELLEETGYAFDSFTYLCNTSSNPSTNSNRMHIFLATGGMYRQPQQLDHAEDIEVVLYSPHEVKQLLRDSAIVQSMHVTALFYAFQQLGWIEMK